MAARAFREGKEVDLQLPSFRVTLVDITLYCHTKDFLPLGTRLISMIIFAIRYLSTPLGVISIDLGELFHMLLLLLLWQGRSVFAVIPPVPCPATAVETHTAAATQCCQSTAAAPYW